jgi:hypothetical protein
MLLVVSLLVWLRLFERAKGGVGLLHITGTGWLWPPRLQLFQLGRVKNFRNAASLVPPDSFCRVAVDST